MTMQWIGASLGGLVGLLIGSFLNVVAYRLPKMMERQWASECAQMANTETPSLTNFNLMVPRSRCPSCGHSIAWYENIPVISFLALRGSCSACRTSISPRYPIVEVATALLFSFCIWKWGISLTGVVWCIYSALLLSLALIDWDTTLLPDDITLPLLWLGVLSASLGWTSVDIYSSLWGVMAGYISLWLIYWAFKLATGKEGMGYGDFKLFAALGAWFGWQTLVPLILMASLIGATVGTGMKFSTGLREGGYVPFGPFLALSGFTALILGPATMRHVIGL
jgi:leader peptidase (prepilin peptidase)/N-methyltransferase